MHDVCTPHSAVVASLTRGGMYGEVVGASAGMKRVRYLGVDANVPRRSHDACNLSARDNVLRYSNLLHCPHKLWRVVVDICQKCKNIVYINRYKHNYLFNYV